MISPEKLAKYQEFVDPEHTGAQYNPRRGLERLIGILSPDPKGIVLAAMGEDWYSTNAQLRLGTLNWLEHLGISRHTFPLNHNLVWSYCQMRYKGEIQDGSLVEHGSMVKKAEEHPFTVYYRRSAVGSELALPLVQNAIRFVVEARKREDKIHYKYDSMGRIIGGINSPSDRRRQLILWDVFKFLTVNPGQHREKDIQDATDIPQGTIRAVLEMVGKTGVINYESESVEIEGKKPKGWAKYKLTAEHAGGNLEANALLKLIKTTNPLFRHFRNLRMVIDHINEFPQEICESNSLSKKLGISPENASRVLMVLKDVGILQRGKQDSNLSVGSTLASANELTYIFYDLICEPAREIAETLSPPPLKAWNRNDVAIFLENYFEERTRVGPQGVKKLEVELFYCYQM